MIDNIPIEMRAYNHWIVWRYEENPNGDKPKKVPYCPHTQRTAMVNDPSSWGTWEQAIAALNSGWFTGLGFVLAEDDPYAFIDLDDPHGDIQASERQTFIFNEFNSYAERSPSGKGLHIIVKGALPSGRKRSFVEVYTSGRFMTMTGDVYRATPIVDYNEKLNILWHQIGAKAETQFYDGQAPQTAEDDEVLQRACNAANGAKFSDLLTGNWQQHYPSQSEADFAFMDIIAFYTQNRDQLTRIFRNSALGARNKTTTIRGVGYIDHMINRSFDRMLPPVDLDHLRIQIEDVLQQQRMKEAQLAQQVYSVQPMAAPVYSPQPVEESYSIPEPSNPVYSVPPGLVGQIARFIYEAAPRPVPEIALAGAIGLMAGICGRSYNISGTGLNQYVLLLARTGTGKESIAKGINKLMSSVAFKVPNCMEFLGPGEIASPQALAKYMSKGPKSFVSLTGEFGLMLKQMCAFNAPPSMIGLRRMLLDLFNKSGEGDVMHKTIYSDKEKNTENILAPAFTLLGESTPERFYENLDEGMISEGLLPRFTTIEYYGKRPDLNEGAIFVKPHDGLVHDVATLCAHSAMLNNANKTVPVITDDGATRILKEFNEYCDFEMRKDGVRDVVEQLWNRAHIKALKLSALIAVGVNPYNPVVTAEVAVWATNIVSADVRNLLGRFERGEVGAETAETKQASEVIKAFRRYVMKPYSEVAKYKIPERMHADRVIPHRFLVQSLAAVAAFRNDKIGSTNAIKRTIESMKASGDIVQILPAQLAKKYEYSGVCYGIANVAAFGFDD